MAQETITLKLVAQDLMSGQVSKAIGSLDKLAKQGGLVGSVAQGIGQSVGQMLNPLALGTKAFGMMTEGISLTVDGLTALGRAYKEDQAEQAQLNNTLMRNISNWRDYTDEIDAAITAGQKLAFTDSEQRLSLGKLVTATRDARRAITLNRLAMDIARQRNIKLSEASQAVTKAAQGQYKGLKSLGYVIDTTASQTENLASVTLQAADSAQTWADTDQGKFAVRLMEVAEAAEANGVAYQRLDGIQKDLGIATLETGNTMVMYGGILMDFLGIGKDATDVTIGQEQSMVNLGKRMQEIGWSYNRMSELIVKDYGSIAKSVDWATSHMNQSMSDFLTPWREQWKQAAAWAKDPFKPAKFEKWLAKQAEKAIENAKTAAENGKPGVAQRWRAIAAAMQSPVITAVGEIKTSIAEIIAAMQVIDGVNATLGNYRRNGSTGRSAAAGQNNLPNGVEVNAAGDANYRGGWTMVGERGPELVNLPGGTSIRSAERSAGAGASVHVHFHGLVSAPSEADGQRVARILVPHIRREMARGGV